MFGMKSKYLKLSVLFLSLIISSCSSFKKIVEPPKVKLENVNIARLSALAADLEIVLLVENPNGIDFDVKNLKYQLDVNDKTITSGTMKEKVIVKAKQTTTVTLPIKISYKDIIGSALLLLDSKGMPYRVKGSTEIGPFTIPFDDDGTLKSTDL